jgi:mRNA degradation ribonuclease J1/J2
VTLRLAGILTTQHQIHCSGHVKGKDLFEIVKAIDAKMLFPIHSDHPEMYVMVTRNMTGR